MSDAEGECKSGEDEEENERQECSLALPPQLSLNLLSQTQNLKLFIISVIPNTRLKLY